MRPDSRYIACLKSQHKTQYNASSFLMSYGFPGLTKKDWDAASVELAKDVMHLAQQLATGIYTNPDLQIVVQKILPVKNVITAILAALTLRKNAEYIAKALSRSGFGEFTADQIELFRKLFFDLSLCTEAELKQLVNKYDEQLATAISKALNNGSIITLLEFGLIPEASADEYLKLVISAAFKVLYEIISGRLELKNPIEIVEAGLKAAEIFKKESPNDSNEMIEMLHKMIQIQTIADDDKNLTDLN